MTGYNSYVSYPLQENVHHFSVFDSPSFDEIFNGDLNVNHITPNSHSNSELYPLFRFLSSRPYQVYYDSKSDTKMLGINIYPSYASSTEISELLPSRYSISEIDISMWGPQAINIYFNDEGHVIEVYDELLRLHMNL